MVVSVERVENSPKSLQRGIRGGYRRTGDHDILSQIITESRGAKNGQEEEKVTSSVIVCINRESANGEYSCVSTSIL